MPQTIPFGTSSSQTIPFGSPSVTPTPRSLSEKIWNGIAATGNVLTKVLPGKQIGESIGTLGGYAYTAAQEKLGNVPKGATEAYDLSAPSPLRVAGDVAAGAGTIASLSLAAPAKVASAALQYGGLGALTAGGSSLAEGQDARQVAKSTALGAGIGAATGAVFNLLGQGITKLASKTAPSTLSFTSGVPKEAIVQASKNPEVAREGLKMSVEKIRADSVKALSTLRTDLSDEFASSLDDVVGKTKGSPVYRGVNRSVETGKFPTTFGVSDKGYYKDIGAFSVSPVKKTASQYGDKTLKGYIRPDAKVVRIAGNPSEAQLLDVKKIGADIAEFLNKDGEMEQVVFSPKAIISESKILEKTVEVRKNLIEYGRNFAREFRLGTKSSPEGVVIEFSKSPIVKAGERANVQEVFKTISTWDDFSAKGMQDLAERVGALRNFESGVKTESSAIISKIYNKIAGTGGVKGLIPKMYPELAKLRTNYAMNRKVLDEIGNVLSESKNNPVAIQSSITRLSNLFKTDRETYLNVIKQLGERSGVDWLSLLAGTEFQKILPNFIRGLGGGAAVSVGASLLNPYLVLLAPLFSPRAVGGIVRGAPAVGKAASVLTRAGVIQAIQKLVPGLGQ